MTIARNLQHVRAKMADALAASPWKQQCTLVAVSKTKPVSDVEEAYNQGQRHFGENYIQELVDKAPQCSADIQWHFIGHLQSNKVKTLITGVPNLYMVESVDSVKLANKLNTAWGQKGAEKPLPVLVQVNTSGEVQKSGVAPEECVQLAQHIRESCANLLFSGLMTIGRFDDDTADCFEKLVSCRKTMSESLGIEEKSMELSMGMSDDYELAIANGSTHVRVGSTIFGARNYAN
ncbi:proline synthetase co-transcribed bacterial protein [Thraustotheca clavata]|uniref:Pyridoxal phosphate homeostasis protein n=1 Tax=Thraustotheca clavata TaxID=74557 RepID=A0A1V9YVT3_9STRA|nr:proline synthetase co-transcribed bacterial protein [Thraustotheca clavata]